MNERFEHKKPIVGRDCERDGFFILDNFDKTIFLEDGFVSKVKLDKKCRGCCAESPRTKWVWHGEDCTDPSRLTKTESDWLEDIIMSPIEGIDSATEVHLVTFACDSCSRIKFKETRIKPKHLV